ncbi:hypothetical protein BG57_25510 [Caballeronia grimmiae]|uniref:Uncharacterized protein n=1 Tax=Caballeronia grimmiae TaxID=1071679 RepID=A0A069P5Z9_9BURK|nr:hypothetical protein BG57_25510 [Caballeronia grimmiae]
MGRATIHAMLSRIRSYPVSRRKRAVRTFVHRFAGVARVRGNSVIGGGLRNEQEIRLYVGDPVARMTRCGQRRHALPAIECKSFTSPETIEPRRAR